MEKNGNFNTISSFNKLWNSELFQNKPRFNGVFSRDHLFKKIDDGAYVINPDEYADIGTHWGLLYFVKEVKLFISIVLVLNMFLKKLKSLWDIKAWKLTFFEYKQTIL